MALHALNALAPSLQRHGAALETTVEGSSMEPTIPTGDSVRIEFCPADALRPGEVAAYSIGDRIVAHRVVCVTSGFLVFRGDATWVPEPVLKGNVLGRVRAVSGSAKGVDLPAEPARSRLWRVCERMALGLVLNLTRAAFSLGVLAAALLNHVRRLALLLQRSPSTPAG